MSTQQNFDLGDMFIRNRGLIENQECLSNAVIAIAGCGREGGSAAIALVRMGVKKFRLADPDTVSVANLNSQCGARVSTIGRNKASVIAEEILEINPQAEVHIETEGITVDNLDRFIRGASIAIDAIDFHSPHISILFHRTARSLGTTVFVAVSAAWNSFFFKFIPNGLSLEKYMGLEENCPPQEALERPIDLLTFCPEPPSYVPSALVADILEKKADIPAVAPAVNMTGAMLAATIYFELSGTKKIWPVPYYYAAGDLFYSRPKKVSVRNKILLFLVSWATKLTSRWNRV